MRDAVVKYGVFYGALLVVGAVAFKLTSLATDGHGVGGGAGGGTSLSISASPGLSIGAGVAALAIAVAVGVLASRLVSSRAGVLNAGVVLAWGAYGLGTLREIVMARADAQSGAGTRGTFTALAVEAAVISVAVAAGVWLIERAGRHKDAGDHESPADAKGLLSAAACGIAGSAVGVWLVAQTGYKGQVIGGAFAGGILAAIAAFAIDHRLRLWPLVAGCLVISVLGPVLAMSRSASELALFNSVVNGSVLRWAQLTGLDAGAGICLGIPVGLSIAKGLLGHAGKVAEGTA